MKSKRPQNLSYHAPVKLDATLLAPSLLGSEAAVKGAIRVLESHLENSAANVEATLDDILNAPGLFEFTLSAISDRVAQLVIKAVLDSFPLECEAYSTSLARRLLDRLSLFFLFESGLFVMDDLEGLKDCRRSVELACPALEVLADFLGRTHGAGGVYLDDDRAPDDIIPVAKMQRAKRAKHVPNHARMDMTPFDNLGIEAPKTQGEAETLAADILVDQKGVLRYYLEILRYPHLKPRLRDIYIPGQFSVTEHDSNCLPEAVLNVDGASEPEQIPSAFPIVRPMKAALYFDSADGFGPWRIMLSNNAQRDLRQAYKKNPSFFEIIVKNMKEISYAQWSSGNHKTLGGTETDFPIFEAKMTADSRLVYRIDCVADFESDMERQVIKVFGVYTHNQLARCPWDAISRALRRMGPEYKARCSLHRNRRENDGLIVPASFPANMDGNAGSASSTDTSEVDKDDLGKLHEMLVRETYVTYSQAFLNSVLADKDVMHVFQVSTREAQIIRHPFSCYVIGRSGTGKTTAILFKMLGIERGWRMLKEVVPRPRQMFITKSRVLAEKVHESFLKLYESLDIADISQTGLTQLIPVQERRQKRLMIDKDEEAPSTTGLPRRFGELEDHHFPLFVTYDQLCALLEAEFNESVHEGGRIMSSEQLQRSRSEFISYEVFLDHYWSHFPENLKKGLDPALVFGEFMGVLKGSEEARGSSTGYLEKATYLNLSHRRHTMFSDQRDSVYELFSCFLRQKRERRGYDAADRTRRILEDIHSQDSSCNKLDFIYIDEAQDNLLIDALVLRSLCRNAASGLFWAGDTAQTISIGSAFRFEDLRAFMWRVEARDRSRLHRQPQLFQLGVNYRSHAGIVNCARSIIELITAYWPGAIDTLDEEKGIVEGVKPVFFSGWDEYTMRYEEFLFGKSGACIEFGHQQCILVRDTEARKRLQVRLESSNRANILTIYESKGLEFDDVLLYDFFADSTVTLAQWRIILHALPVNHVVKQGLPTFDTLRHNKVCRELKLLYVATTRARQKLWIADCSDKADPIRLLWSTKRLVETCTPGSNVQHMAKPSTSEQWAESGASFFDHKQYMLSMNAYEHAYLPRERGIARAYYLQEQARLVTNNTTSDGKTRAAAYADAADAFSAAADDAIEDEERLMYFKHAGQCFSHSGDNRKAASAYYRAAEYTLSAQCYRQASMFDDAVKVIKQHRNDVDAVVAKSIIGVCGIIYLRRNRLDRARALFQTDEELLRFMGDYGFSLSRATFLETLRRSSEAAEIHLDQGRVLKAIRLFSLNPEDTNSMRRASQCLLHGLWQNLSLGTELKSKTATSDQTLQELLGILEQADTRGLEENVRDEVLMFRAIQLGDSAQLVHLGNRFRLRHKDNGAAFLCLDHAYTEPFKFRQASASEITTALQSFSWYVNTLRGFAFHEDPSSQAEMQRLFNFKANHGNSFLLQSGTLLHVRYSDGLTSPATRSLIISRSKLNALISHILRVRLRQRITDETTVCHAAEAFQPCVPFVVYGRCTRPNCPRSHTGIYDEKAYNLRVRIHLQQVLIFHAKFRLEERWQRLAEQRFWLHRLYEAIFPPFYALGNIQCLIPALIPEFERGFRVVKGWIRDLLYSVKPYRPNVDKLGDFLTPLMRFTSLGYLFDARATAYHIRRIPPVFKYRPPPLLRAPDNTYAVHDMVSFLSGGNKESVLRGIQFVRHIFDNRIDVDICVLCDFLDDICGSLVVDRHLEEHSTLHGVTLPRSWLVRLTQKLENPGSWDIELHRRYLEPLGELLEQLYTGNHADYLLFESHGLGWESRLHIRNIFIARICKNLCLLGINFRDGWLHEEILKTIGTICKPERDGNHSTIYRGYVAAITWQQLAMVVQRESTARSSMDEIVQLQAAARNTPSYLPPILPNVRRIEYTAVKEIPQLLTSSDPLTSSRDSGPAPHSISRDILLATNKSAQNMDGRKHNTEGTKASEIDTEEVDSASAAVSAKELDAAHVLWAAYRRHVRYRQSAAKTMYSMRSRHFSACLDVSTTVYGPRSYYRLLFLGPLPHLLVALECMHAYMQTAKVNLQRKLHSVQHEELEKLQERLAEISHVLDRVIDLQTILHPQSDLHKRRNKEELESHAREVQELMGRVFPSGATQPGQEDLQLAMKAILGRKSHSVRKPKPELNVDEWDAFSMID